MKRMHIDICIGMISLIFLLLFFINYKERVQDNKSIEVSLRGEGTMNKPYLVSDATDLKWLRDSVNAGETFENKFFLQTKDINLENENWVPIGIFNSGNFFYGIYDGGTHKIKNLFIDDNKNKPANGGLFGQLGGMVINLGIESGKIKGDYVGGIASHAIGNKAAIINCYNKASIIGTGRAGGICDNFTGGTIMNCANFGEVSAPCSAQIVAYNVSDLINVYPEEKSYTTFFTGGYKQPVIFDEKESVLQWLNDGVEYIDNYSLFEPHLLKRWTEN